MIRYFLDSEFAENGKTIDLISIALICEDGREYYAQSCEFGTYDIDPWVREHVLPSLSLCPHMRRDGDDLVTILRRQMSDHGFLGGKCWAFRKKIEDCPWRTREQLREDILAFTDIEQYGKPEFWAWYADYDWVVFCQLFGKMIDLPKGYPMYCRDLKQWCDMVGNPRLPEQAEGNHHALADARHNAVRYQFLDQITIDKILR